MTKELEEKISRDVYKGDAYTDLKIDDNIHLDMKLVTIQASAFKSTFEVLKDILNDVNIYFRPQGCICYTGYRANVSHRHVLSADNFEEYECHQEEIIAGINISNTFKLLKTITNNDVLKLK